MEFKDIQNINFNIPKSSLKKDDKRKHENKSEEQKQNIKKLPSNPAFWQNAAGIKKKNVSFGNSQTSTEQNDEYIEKCIEKIKYYLYWQTQNEDNIKTYQQAITRLIPKGKDAVENYLALIIYSKNLWMQDDIMQYNTLAEEFIANASEFDADYTDIVARTLMRVSSNSTHFEKMREFINNILTSHPNNIENTILWINNTVDEFFYDKYNDDNYLENASESFEIYSEFMQNFNNVSDDDKMSIIKFKLSNDEMISCSKLISQGKLNPEYFNNLIKNISTYNTNELKLAHNIVNKILTDEKNLETFNFLMSKKNIKENLSVADIHSMMDKDIDFFKEIISKLEEKDNESEYLFSDSYKMQDFMSYIDKDNFEDFLTATKDIPLQASIGYAQTNVNPKTKKFDKIISEKTQELTEKYDIIPNYATEIAKSGIDLTTGEFSSTAYALLEYIYQPKEKIKSKLIHLVRYYSPKAHNITELKMNIEQSSISELVDCLKDNNGAFNKKNFQYLKKLLAEKNIDFSYIYLPELMSEVKDKNGIVDKHKGLCGLNLVKSTQVYRSALEIIREVNEFYSASNENKELILTLSKYIKDISGISSLKKLYDIYKQEDGTLPALITDKLTKFVKLRGNFNSFEDIFYGCMKDNSGDLNKDFDNESFNKIMQLIEYEELLNPEFQVYYYRAENQIPGKTYLDIINQNLDLKTIPFKDKVKIINILIELRQYVANPSIDGYEFLDKTISDIDTNLNLDNVSLKISPQVKADFLGNVLRSNASNELTEFEQVLKDSIPILKSMTEGLPLTYPRKDFLADLSNICNTPEKLNLLKQKTGIIPITSDGTNIIGYNDIINLENLDINNPDEKQIYDCLYKFMYENTVQTGNTNLDKELNYIIKACPEFINTIGKKQHSTHQYTLDIHSLLVLANSIENPQYLTNLNETDRSMLKLAAIFHDIIKKENETDKGHQNQSSLYARSIVKKFFNNPEHKDRLCEIIQNHHWLEEYSTSDQKDKKAKELAFKFRRPNDFELAKIMAKSDLKAVSSEFYNAHKDNLNPEKFKEIEQNLNFFYSTGNAIFSTYIVAPDKLNNHIREKDGIKYKVIDFHRIKDDEDLAEYGFIPGTKTDDVKFLVHMVEENSIYNHLKTVQLLTSPLNGGVLSESLITPKYKKTYADRSYGVMLSQINTNIINENQENQGSGYKKDIDNILELIFNTSSIDKRVQFRNAILSNLGISPADISDEEYGNFYRGILANKTSLNQINPDKIFSIGKYSFRGKDLRNAIIKYQDNLIDKTEKKHNELVGYTPKIQAVIAKANNIDELNDEFLQFAHEYNYPIILI